MTLSIVVVGRIDSYAVVDGYGLHSGHVAMSSGVAWSRLRKQGVKFATVGLSRCSLSIACLNVGHSLRRRAMPVFVGFHMRWPVTVSPPSAAEGSGEVAIARVLRLLRDGGDTTIDCFMHF